MNHLGFLFVWLFFFFGEGGEVEVSLVDFFFSPCKLDPRTVIWKENANYPKILIKLWLLKIIVQA